MTVIKFAKLFRITRTTVYSWIAMGMPASIDRRYNGWLVHFEEAIEWLIKNKVRFM